MLKKSIIAIIALAGSLAAAPMASAAVITNHAGGICKSFYPVDVGMIAYGPGAISRKTTDTYVLCPLTRNTSGANGAYVYVDVTHVGSQTTFCIVQSYSYTGALLGGATEGWSGSGFHEFALNVTGAGKSDSWSDYSVLCLIPGNSAAQILGVDLYEL